MAAIYREEATLQRSQPRRSDFWLDGTHLDQVAVLAVGIYSDLCNIYQYCDVDGTYTN